ncbi:hypothetical protein Trydic_g13111 [Trypoxylus dichotomus]
MDTLERSVINVVVYGYRRKVGKKTTCVGYRPAKVPQAFIYAALWINGEKERGNKHHDEKSCYIAWNFSSHVLLYMKFVKC